MSTPPSDDTSPSPAGLLFVPAALGGSPGARRLAENSIEVLPVAAPSLRAGSATPAGPLAPELPDLSDMAVKANGSSATTGLLDGNGILTFASAGWRRPLFVEQLAARWAAMQDLPLETASRDDGAPVTPQELASLPLLKESILKRLGLDAVPTGFRAHHFTQWKLLCMLRARGGDVAKSTDRAVDCIRAVDLALEAARRFEMASDALKDVRDQYFPYGFYGRDTRGAPVLYIRLGKLDLVGFIRELGVDFHHDAEWYAYMLQWDAISKCNAELGMALQGHVIVLDLSGFSLMNVLASKSVAKQVLAKPTYPEGEHPMPEGARKILICGAPWWVGKLWAIAKLLLPARTTAKMSIFSDSQWADFGKALFARVDRSQVPEWVPGGKGATPWPHGSGGPVPKGLNAAARDREAPKVKAQNTI